ncbi:PH domain-containing protein [Acinetobacter sp. ULE_I010]|uniref:PH domain-containing protein n=1 Tax=Acinetobacter sp. ULE_I010 TaxID=3373065 RepID=UPI003AF84275
MQKFHSKIDWWILGFVIAMTGLLVQLLFTMYAKGTMEEYPEHTMVYIFTIAVLWWPVFSTTYAIGNNTLTIRSMFLKWVIPLENIKTVSKTNNSISSPALSLDRLKIEYLKDGKMKQILVSPRDQQAFRQTVEVNSSQI